MCPPSPKVNGNLLLLKVVSFFIWWSQIACEQLGEFTLVIVLSVCQGYWKHKLSRLRDCDSNCRCCNYVRLQCNLFLMSLPVSLCSLQILKWQRKVSSGSSQSQAIGHHFSVACILCNRTRMKVTHLSIPTSPKPRMWVLALTKIHLQAGSVWFRNQVAQMSCIVVQQT